MAYKVGMSKTLREWVETGRSIYLSIYLFGVLCRFQHCTCHITTGSWKGRGNQYIEFVRVLYCKLPTNGKQKGGGQRKASDISEDSWVIGCRVSHTARFGHSYYGR